MAKKPILVIVESPAKSKTINKYLGNGYIVKSSVGHIRDLPTGKKENTKRKKTEQETTLTKEELQWKALVKRMGVDPEHNWKARYEILPGKEKVVSELKRLAYDAEEIYLATDLDREGEAIAWHLREILGGDHSRYKRVVFNEITKKAIHEAFQHPQELDINRVNAQQSRRFLDRVVGFMVSPLLWEKVARGLSAGRVQSVAVKLLVEREREIRQFVPDEFWKIFSTRQVEGMKVKFELVKIDGKTPLIPNEQASSQILTDLNSNNGTVTDCEEKPTQVRPSPPFITSTLQQAASSKLGFGVKKTMVLAQRLYEAGFITYMRTDSTFLSNDALTMVREHIANNLGDKYLPENAIRYGNKANAQEAHEAIRPSNVEMKAEDLYGLERDAQRLYDLIWRQFVSCQMTSALYTSTIIRITSGKYTLQAKGRVVVFDGFTRVRGANKSEDDIELPKIAIGAALQLISNDAEQHFTKPPARYSEASLVKEMEKRSIGRPSTYATIISTIQERGYVKLENKKMYAEKMGEIVVDRLNESFSNLMDYQFTAELENELDNIANGSIHWLQVLERFYVDFKRRLVIARSAEGMRTNPTVLINEIKCPACERPMMIRTGSTGVFLGCSGYNLPIKERCKKTMNLSEVIDGKPADGDELKDLMSKRRCDKCGSSMDAYIVNKHKKLHVCGNNPDCDGYIVEEGEFAVAVSQTGPTLPCDKCDGTLELKTGRFGSYYGCNQCNNTRKLMRNGEVAPPRADAIRMEHLRSKINDDYFVLRDGGAGLFLAASNFPKVRETRMPKVSELRTVSDKLDAKFHFLLTAPDTDPDNNPTVVRFDQKTKTQYVGSEKEDGKLSDWAKMFVNGQWVDKPKSKPSKSKEG